MREGRDQHRQSEPDGNADELCDRIAFVERVGEDNVKRKAADNPEYATYAGDHRALSLNRRPSERGANLVQISHRRYARATDRDAPLRPYRDDRSHGRNPFNPSRTRNANSILRRQGAPVKRLAG